MGNVISSLFNDKLFYDQVFKPKVKHSIKVLGPNEKLLLQGEKHSFFGFIKQGSVSVVLNETTGDQNPIHTVVATLSQNDLFGEFRLFDDYPASADVITATECEIVMIDVQSFRSFLDTDAVIGYKVFLEMLQALVKRLHHSNTTVMHLMKSAIEFQKQLHELIREK